MGWGGGILWEPLWGGPHQMQAATLSTLKLERPKDSRPKDVTWNENNLVGHRPTTAPQGGGVLCWGWRHGAFGSEVKKQEDFQAFLPEDGQEAAKEPPKKEVPPQKGSNSPQGFTKDNMTFCPDITCYKFRLVCHYSQDCKASLEGDEDPKPKDKTTPSKEIKLAMVPMPKSAVVPAWPENK